MAKLTPTGEFWLKAIAGGETKVRKNSATHRSVYTNRGILSKQPTVTTIKNLEEKGFIEWVLDGRGFSTVYAVMTKEGKEQLG